MRRILLALALVAGAGSVQAEESAYERARQRDERINREFMDTQPGRGTGNSAVPCPTRESYVGGTVGSSGSIDSMGNSTGDAAQNSARNSTGERMDNATTGATVTHRSYDLTVHVLSPDDGRVVYSGSMRLGLGKGAVASVMDQHFRPETLPCTGKAACGPGKVKHVSTRVETGDIRATPVLLMDEHGTLRLSLGLERAVTVGRPDGFRQREWDMRLPNVNVERVELVDEVVRLGDKQRFVLADGTVVVVSVLPADHIAL